MLTFQWWSDTPGEQRICLVCEYGWTSREMEPRAFVGADYLGHVCDGCTRADPDVLRERLQGPLAEARASLRLLEAADAWLATQAPRQRRQLFRVVSRRACAV